MRDLELLLELRERILVAKLCPHVDEDKAKRRCNRYGHKNAEQAIESAPGKQ